VEGRKEEDLAELGLSTRYESKISEESFTFWAKLLTTQ
jgi:hypothetical protein